MLEEFRYSKPSGGKAFYIPALPILPGTQHGQMHRRPVAVAMFDAAMAAGSVTISTGVKLIKQMQLAEAQRCPLLLDWDSGGADVNDGVASLDMNGPYAKTPALCLISRSRPIALS